MKPSRMHVDVDVNPGSHHRWWIPTPERRPGESIAEWARRLDDLENAPLVHTDEP